MNIKINTIMKKLFLFATIAAAGLFASCSSTDDAISDAPNSAEVEGADGERQAIQIGIGNLVSVTTRGTGTVGDVESATAANNPTSRWAGQSLHAFMFTKGAAVYSQGNNPEFQYIPSTLDIAKSDGADLYNNTELIAPGSAENLIPEMGAAHDSNSGYAMIKGGAIQYYPNEGNFDFFAYHGDNAVTQPAAITQDGDATVYYGANDEEVTNGTHKVGEIKTSSTSTKWTVPFEIDGSQDLMSTKAELTDAQATFMNGKADAYNKKRYYSAYSARQSTAVQPVLTFNHLLTRLAFKVKGGSVEATGYHGDIAAVNWTDETAAEHNADLDGALAATAGPFYSFAACWTDQLNEQTPAWTTTGKVQFIKEQVENDGTYTIIQVIQNNLVNHADMDGKYFAVKNTAANLTPALVEELHWVTKNGDNYTIGSTTQEGTILETKSISVYNLATVTTADATAAINAYNATLQGAVTSGSVRIPAQEAGQDFAKAVKVKKIQVYSKKTGTMAVAWVDPNTATEDNDKLYEMSPISVKTYNAIYAAQQGDDAKAAFAARWTAKHQTDNDNTTPIIYYEYAYAEQASSINATAYTALTDAEKAYATCINGGMTDAKKLTWDATTDWLTLKARPYAEQNGSGVPAVADFADLTSEKALLEAEKAALEAELAALTNSLEEYTAKQGQITTKQNEIDALDAVAAGRTTITKYTFDNMTDAGKLKYTAIDVKVAKNKQLITLSPTMPEYDPEGANDEAKFKKTPVGEALIVAPSAEDYQVKVTVEQNVRTSWANNNNTEPKEQTFDLTITAPNGNFKQNYSYDIVLTVYDFKRIEVHTVIMPWDNVATPIEVGADE